MEKLPEQEDVRVAFMECWTEAAKKTLIAFANTLGGDLYFGVTGKGAAEGLRKREVEAISRCVLDFCRADVDPVMADIVSTQTLHTGLGNYLLRVSVLPGEDRPYAFKGRRYTGGAYVRDGAVSVTASEEEIRDMIRDSDPRPWESRLSRREDLSFAEAAHVFKKHNAAFSPALYRQLGLVDDGGNFTLLGELLSDQNRTRLVVGTFSGDGSSPCVHEFSGSLLKQMDKAFDMFAEINPELIQKTERLASLRQFAWPPKALREALVNCAVHRDYSRMEPTKISIFPNRCEFVSYGSIPGRLSVEDIVLEGVGKCRSERLAGIFRDLGWMQDCGSGFPMIWRAYANLDAQPKLQATRRVFRIVLPKIQIELRGTLKERCRALFGNYDALTTADLMKMLNVSRTSANSAVNALLKDGQIEKVGSGRTTRYRSLIR